MKETLEIRVSSGPGRVDLMRLRGPLDAHNNTRLLERCSEIHEQRRHLVLNMHEVSFVSSSGIGVLLALNEDFRGDGVSLRIANPSVAVRSAVALLNLDTFLAIYGSEDEAMRDLAA